MSGAAKSVLVLGANGFIGSYLVDYLVTAGYNVKAFDRYSHDPQFKPSPNIEIVSGDFFDDIVLSEALDGVEYLFHCYSATTPFVSDSDPYQDITQNVLRSVQLFEKSVEKDVKKIIYISSGGAVYGGIAEHKNVTEDDVPRPVSPYGIGKLTTEYYLEYFNRKYGLQNIVFRLSNPYGRRQVTKNNQGVVPTFLSKMQNNETITIIGDGNSTRDYIFIEDAAKMITETFSGDTAFNIYNIGSGKQTSVNEIIAELENQLGKKASVEFIDAPKTFLQKSQINVGRFTQEFHLVASTSLQDGIKTLL